MADGSSALCIAEIKAATGDKLTEHEIEQVVEAIDQRRRVLVAEGKIDGIERRMQEIATEEANKARMAALLQKKNTALTIIARDRAEAHVKTLTSQGLSPKKAVLAIFEGTVKGIRQARHSIYATKLAFEARYVGDMMADVLRQVPEALKLTRDPEFAKDVVREMFELRKDGVPGKSGNPDAAKVAKIFAKHAEISRVDANRLGAAIGKLDDWGGPHAHDAVKMLEVTADAWVNRIAGRLDLKRTFPDLTADEARKVLLSSYATITTGKSAKLTAQRKGQFQGPRNLGRSLSKDRVFHFKSADDWLAYQAEFGHGNVWTGMLAHQRKMAAITAQMQMLGPNPEIMMGSLLDRMQMDIRNDPAIPQAKKGKLINSLNIDGNSQIRQAMSEASGVTSGVNPDGITAHRILAGYRATQSMAKLGGAVISSISDLVTQSANLKYQGRSLFGAYHDQFVGMIKAVSRRTGADEKEIAYLLGEGMDGMLDNLNASAFAEDSLPGMMSSAQTKFFRWSGLTGWTDNIRATGARMMAAHMGKMAGKTWSGLPEQFRFVLGQHGITEQHWGLIRDSAFTGPNGNRYVTPDRIGQLPDEAFTPFIQGAVTPNKLGRAKLDAEIALRRFYSDEINFGVIETDARSRRFTLRGTQGGTFAGELLRLMFQFKGWPVAYTQKVLGRAVFGQRDAATQALHIGHLLAGTMIAGYAAMTAKDYIKHYDRRKFVDENGSVNVDTLLASFAQGGGAGIYGDFLFGHTSRFGGGLLDTIAGPGIGTVTDFADNVMGTRDHILNKYVEGREDKGNAGAWLNWTLSNTPFANLSYARWAADMLVLNALRDAVSPGFLDRQRATRQRDYGQTILYPQTLGGMQ